MKHIPTLKPIKGKQADILRIYPPISSRPRKSIFAKSKYFKKIQLLNLNNQLYAQASNSNNYSYVQVFKGNIKEIIKIKNVFSNLSSNKTIEIYVITNNKELKGKLKFNMTTKDPSRKQMIVPMSTNNSEAIILQANEHILNINRFLKGIKSDVSANFICSDNKGVIINTNKATASSDLSIVEKYIKKLNNINLNNIMSPQLFQSKSYLKILEVLYFLENMNLPITSDIIETVIKDTYIFNDIVLVS